MYQTPHVTSVYFRNLSTLTHYRSLLHSSHSLTMWVLLPSALPQGRLCVQSFSSTRLLVYLFLLPAGAGPLHKNVVSAFSRRPSGRAIAFEFLHFYFIPANISKCSFSFAFFRSANLPHTSILSFTLVLYPPNFSMDIISS